MRRIGAGVLICIKRFRGLNKLNGDYFWLWPRQLQAISNCGAAGKGKQGLWVNYSSSFYETFDPWVFYRFDELTETSNSLEKLFIPQLFITQTS